MGIMLNYFLPIFYFQSSLLGLISFSLVILYLLQPAKRHAYAQGGDNVFAPVERELIFDIVSYWIHMGKKIAAHLSVCL